MKKTVDLTKKEIEQVEKYQKENGLKNFSAAIKDMISNASKFSNDNFILLADAIVKLDEKIENLSIHVAPRSAGEVKK